MRRSLIEHARVSMEAGKYTDNRVSRQENTAEDTGSTHHVALGSFEWQERGDVIDYDEQALITFDAVAAILLHPTLHLGRYCACAELSSSMHGFPWRQVSIHTLGFLCKKTLPRIPTRN